MNENRSPFARTYIFHPPGTNQTPQKKSIPYRPPVSSPIEISLLASSATLFGPLRHCPKLGDISWLGDVRIDNLGGSFSVKMPLRAEIYIWSFSLSPIWRQSALYLLCFRFIVDRGIM